MEFLIIAVIGGLFLAIIIISVLWVVISRAVDNGVGWLISNFGNEQAVKRQEKERRRRESP